MDTTVSTSTRTSGLAVTSMILGILSIVLGFLFVPPLLSVIFGHVALNQCKKDPNVKGRGMAIAGVVLGYVVLTGLAVSMIFFGSMLGFAASVGNSVYH